MIRPLLFQGFRDPRPLHRVLDSESPDLPNHVGKEVALLLSFPEVFLEGFWVCGGVCGDRSVFVTSHRPAHTSRAHVFSFDRILHFAFEVISCWPTFHPVAPPRL